MLEVSVVSTENIEGVDSCQSCKIGVKTNSVGSEEEAGDGINLVGSSD